MANTLKHFRSGTTGTVPTNAQIQQGQIAINYFDKVLFILDNDNNVVAISSAAATSAANTAVQSVNSKTGTAITLAAPDIGTYGVAALDSGGKVDISVIPESLIGAVTYQGAWNAATNVPTLPDPTTAKGEYWVVNTAGTQFSLDFTLGDWVISNGTAWEKVDALDVVSSVAGKTGAVVLAAGDIASGIFDAARLGAGPGNSMVLTTDASGNPTWIPSSSVGSGTVTSVGITVPAALLSVSGSPITDAGTIVIDIPARAANLVFAGPTTGTAASPTFRALVADDIPVLDEGTF